MAHSSQSIIIAARRSFSDRLSESRLNSFLSKKPKVGSLAEEYFERKRCSLLVHPESGFLLCWDVLLLSFLVLQGLYIPFLVCFSYPLTGFMLYFDTFITMCYLFDILLNFNTAYTSKGTLVMSRSKIAKHYFKTWLFIDLLSSFPYDWLSTGQILQEEEDDYDLSNSSQLLRLFRVTKFVRVLRLARFAKLKKMTVTIEENIDSDLLSSVVIVLRLCSVVLFLAHWNACLWFLVGNSASGLHPDSWLTQLLREADHDYDTAELYVTCIYWSFTTMITVGYGEIHPVSNDEKVMCMFSMVLASAFFGYIIGSLTSLIEERNAEKNFFRDILLGANQYMRKYKLPGELRYRIRSYLNYLQEYNNKSTVVDASVLESLSLPLREEVSILTNGPVLSVCPIFMTYFDLPALSKLCLVMEEVSLAPGDVLFKEGQTSRTLYFVLEGTVTLYLDSYKCNLKELSSHQYFGEIGFFMGRPRTCSAKSDSFITLLVMEYAKAAEALKELQQAQNFLELLATNHTENHYKTLFIRCYICLVEGHIACECPEMELKARMNIQSVWMQAKQQKIVKPELSRAAVRKRRHVRKRFNILGMNHDLRKCRTDALRLKVDQFDAEPSVEYAAVHSELPPGQNSFKRLPLRPRKSLRQHIHTLSIDSDSV